VAWNAADLNSARGGGNETENEFDGGALPASIWPEQPENFAGMDFQIQRIDGSQPNST
jgi:hypothetical protein